MTPTTMTIETHDPARTRWVARPIVLLVTAIAAMMLFAGAMVDNASARPITSWGIDSVNYCLDVNGDPSFFEFGGTVMFYCHIPGGSWLTMYEP